MMTPVSQETGPPVNPVRFKYACTEYAGRLTKHGITPSMSRVANPYDNAKADIYWS